MKVSNKPQYVDKIPKAITGKVGDLLDKVDERKQLDAIADELELRKIWDRNLDVLSGGELQRVAVAAALSRNADVYLFDEPSSYLDVKQRLSSCPSDSQPKRATENRHSSRTRLSHHRLPLRPNLRLLR